MNDFTRPTDAANQTHFGSFPTTERSAHFGCGKHCRFIMSNFQMAIRDFGARFMRNQRTNSVRVCDPRAGSVNRKWSGVLTAVIPKGPQEGLSKVTRLGATNFLGATDVSALAMIRTAASTTANFQRRNDLPLLFSDVVATDNCTPTGSLAKN